MRGDIERSISLMRVLVLSLRESGNNETSSFIELMANSLRTNRNVEIIKEDIRKMASIVQYGDFTPKQERLFYDIQDSLS